MTRGTISARSNSLSLLAYKVAPNTFDLSTGLVHVSIRDQIVRGITLVRDLIAGDQLKNGDQILIVGAGVAGISAACHAEEHGIEALVIDSADHPFVLQRGIRTRFVGPYIYEWPACFHDDQRLPPPSSSVLDAWNTGNHGLEMIHLEPKAAGDIADDWTKWMQVNRRPTRVLCSVDPGKSKAEIRRWIRRVKAVLWLAIRPRLGFDGVLWNSSMTKSHETISPKFVILAAGMGPENVRWEHPSLPRRHYIGDVFWKDPASTSPLIPGNPAQRVLILGGGDGALQDTLKCLFPHEMPLETLHHLLANPTAKRELDQQLPKILAIEQQHATSTVWSSGDGGKPELEALGRAYGDVIDDLSKSTAIYRELEFHLRNDIQEVHLAVKDDYLGKAYSLNRLLVLLVDACQKRFGTIKTRLLVRYRTTATSISTSGPPFDVELSEAGKPAQTLTNVRHISVRFGVRGDQAFGQLIGLSKRDFRNRGELARVPQTFWPIT